MPNLRGSMYTAARLMGDVNSAVHVRQVGGNKVKSALRKRHFTGVTEIRVGYFSDRRYPDGTLIREVAVANEIGDRTHPSRPFIAETNKSITQGGGNPPATVLLQQHSQRGISTSVFPPQLIPPNLAREMAEAYQDEIQQTIMESPHWAVPNAPLTVALKGHDHPLIDSGIMGRQIDIRLKRGRYPNTAYQIGQRGGPPSLRSLLYRSARLIGDVQAITSGNAMSRIGSRAYGKLSGRLIGGTQSALFGGQQGGAGRRVAQRGAFRGLARVQGSIR